LTSTCDSNILMWICIVVRMWFQYFVRRWFSVLWFWRENCNNFVSKLMLNAWCRTWTIQNMQVCRPKWNLDFIWLWCFKGARECPNRASRVGWLRVQSSHFVCGANGHFQRFW
jgi:hypothetical protein